MTLQVSKILFQLQSIIEYLIKESKMNAWWPGINLRNVVKVIAIFEMILCLLISIPAALCMLDVCFEGRMGIFVEMALGIPRTIQLLIFMSFWTIIVIKFILDVHLYKGANKNNFEALRLWLAITSGVLLSCYFWGVLSINLFWTKRAFVKMISISISIGCYKGFQIVAVYKLMKRMKEGLHFSSVRVTSPVAITELGFENSQRNFHQRHSVIEQRSAHENNNNGRNYTNEFTSVYKII